ncbi:hypothetical protein [Actinoplanes sp. DH11]|uniref:DUF7336 domain-containing protein n=1 Tax=Actinoplanes sp. DH11 TaxID=2857011 RepID=UPI001E55CA45|nr:hypothetical protein [Actinoplanes sp. DH11]
MSDVFVVWHVRHAASPGGRPVAHRGPDGAPDWDEQQGDDLKMLGVYTTEQGARERIERARRSPGFRDEPDCFLVDCCTLDEDQWSDGFISVPRGD